jgi:hypothetical protein
VALACRAANEVSITIYLKSFGVNIINNKSRAIAQAFSRRRLTARPGFAPGSVHVGFTVDKVALGQDFFPEFFGFPLSV